MARRYGTLPSRILGESVTDFVLNLTIANEGIKWENKQAERAERENRKAQRRRR